MRPDVPMMKWLVLPDHEGRLWQVGGAAPREARPLCFFVFDLDDTGL